MPPVVRKAVRGTGSERATPAHRYGRPMTTSGSAADWFLSAKERGNPATALDRDKPEGAAWTTGNLVRPLVHGASYFGELVPAVERMQPGDLLMFADWRGDPDERLLGTAGSEAGHVFARAAARGVLVHGLFWRSHWDRLAFSAEENRHLGEQVNAAGGCCLLDMRVRVGGSHHQKFVVLGTGTASSWTSPSLVGSTCVTADETTPAMPAIRSGNRWRRSTAVVHPGTTFNWPSRDRRLPTWRQPFANAGRTHRR